MAEAKKDQKDKPKKPEKDPKELAKEVLKDLIKLTSSGKLPKEIYDLIAQQAGKTNATEKQSIAFITNVATNMAKLKTNSVDPDPKEVQKVLRGFAKRRDDHGLYGKAKPWSDYLNDPMLIWTFDNEKVWADYITNKLK